MPDLHSICFAFITSPWVAYEELLALKEVVTNLMTTRIEVREEDHPDVVKHVHQRHVQVIVVPLSCCETSLTASFPSE